MKKDENGFRISNLSLLLTSSIVMMIILLSLTTELVSAQAPSDSTDKDIKYVEYTNSEGRYKISYPSDAEILQPVWWSTTITDEKGEWKFEVFSSNINYSSLEEHANYEIQALNKAGNKIFEKKPLTVAGFPATMITSLDDETGKGKLKFIEIVMHTNNKLHEFYVSSSVDKFDQYAPIFFTMLKSFKLTDVSDGNEGSDIRSNTNVNVSGIEDILPVVKSSKVLDFSGENYADVENSAEINLNSFTVSTWFNTEMDATEETFLINKGIVDKPDYLTGSNLNFGLYLTQDEKVSGGFEEATGDDHIITSPGSYNDGNWHQAVLTFDQPSATLKLYIDGIQVTTDTYDIGIIPDIWGNEAIRLGAGFVFVDDNTIGTFIGQLDDIQVWDVAFTEQEIVDLFNTESKLSR